MNVTGVQMCVRPNALKSVPNHTVIDFLNINLSGYQTTYVAKVNGNFLYSMLCLFLVLEYPQGPGCKHSNLSQVVRSSL